MIPQKPAARLVFMPLMDEGFNKKEINTALQ